MPWPQKSRTTEKRCASAKVWIAWPISPRCGAGLHRFDAAHHRVVGDVDQPLRLDADLADIEHAAGVAMPAVDDGGDVDIDDVAVQQLAVAGNAVADDMVDRGADRAREAAIVQRRRNRLVGDDEIVAQLVQLAGGDAGLDMGRDKVERLRRQAAGPAHRVECLRVVDLDAAGVVTPIVHGLGIVHCVAPRVREAASGLLLLNK